MTERRPPRRRPTFEAIPRHRGREPHPAPPPFKVRRATLPGRHPLFEVFEGLADTVPFQKYPGDDRKILEIARHTSATVTDGPGWMYVAPRKTPPEVRQAGFRMVESAEDEIVVARTHLTNSPTMDLYLDIIHEFLHILQRRQGRELWPGFKFSYVDRPTEVEAYAFSVAEARRLGVPDRYLRKYLEVTWVKRSEYHRLLRHLGISVR